MRAAVAEGLLQVRSVKPAGPGRAEIAGLRNHVCVKPYIGSAVCMGIGTWVYLCANLSVESERCVWVSKVLCVHKVKLFKDWCRKGLDAVPPCPAPEPGRPS